MFAFGTSGSKPAANIKRKEVKTTAQQPSPRPTLTPDTRTKHVSQIQQASAGQQAPRPSAKPPSVKDRYNMTPAFRSKPKKQIMSQARAGQKRKSETPQPRFASDSEGESDEDQQKLELEQQRRKKRVKTHEHLRDHARDLRDTTDWRAQPDAKLEFIHSSQLTSGVDVRGFEPIYLADGDAEVLLQYPSFAPLEKFRMMKENGYDGYNAILDIRRTMEVMLEWFLPASRRTMDLTEDSSVNCISVVLNPSKPAKLPTVKKLIDEFNELVRSSLEDGSIARNVDNLPRLELDLVERIMSQSYVRTVSPFTDAIHKNTGPKSDVTYGELLPGLCDKIFGEVKLTSKDVFLDLGSGVGNIVIQAALQCGCESWGIELVDKSHELAVAQAAEFQARARLWGLTHGPVNLIHGNFQNCPQLTDLLARATVIIVNNFVFSAETNEFLKARFLDLQEGAKVISLKSFVAKDFGTRNDNDLGAVFEERKETSWEGHAVSWEGDAVDYFIAAKNSKRLEQRRGARR